MKNARDRLRLITDPADLLAHPVGPDDLLDSAVFFGAGVTGEGDTLECIGRLLPWVEPWRDHPKWVSGVWRCEVTGRAGAYSTGELRERLAFHTDMTRYVEPPRYTIVRCLREDSGGGGANYLLHVEDILRRLQELGEERMLRLLHAPRTLNARGGPVSDVPLIARDWRNAPARIFNPHAATEGLHLTLNAEEIALLDALSAMFESWTDLTAEVRLGRYEMLAFSNRSWLHGRAPCLSVDRITEVCLGNVLPAAA